MSVKGFQVDKYKMIDVIIKQLEVERENDSLYNEYLRTLQDKIKPPSKS